MRHAQTIALARGLISEGRTGDVVRMIEPLLQPLPGGTRRTGEDAGMIVLRCILARVRLLRYGDALEVISLLGEYEPSRQRDGLPSAVRAEVALWLGWARAWQDENTYDDARALNLLDEADRLFREELNVSGRCWTLIGQALAYISIDEYSLMLQVLKEASTLQEKLQDAQAGMWIHDLQIAGARFQGHYGDIPAHIEALKELGTRYADPSAMGRAHAYQAVLDFDLGRSPGAIIEHAVEAETILTRSILKAGYPLLAAFRTHIRALLRQGEWNEAERIIDLAVKKTGTVPAAPFYIEIQRARVLILRGRYAEADLVVDHILGHMKQHRHQVLASSAALVRGELLKRQGHLERALEWIERAYRNARETGYGRHQLRALLALVDIYTALGNLQQARQYLRIAEEYEGYFSLLPFAAFRFRVLGDITAAEQNVEEARAFYAQALSAYSLLGDVYRTAQMQLALARTGLKSDPVQARPLLDAAIRTFSQLHAHPECEAARLLLKQCPSRKTREAASSETYVGTSLARAALSVELVAETWLQVVSRFLPDCWKGVFQTRDGVSWFRVHEHGTPTKQLSFPDTNEAYSFVDGVRWVRLRNQPGPVFIAGVEIADPDDPAWQDAFTRLQPWLPVAALALDHALLRSQWFDTSYRFDAHDNGSETPPLKEFVYSSTAMREVVQQIYRIRSSHSPVLIVGESGTGKELVARAVHETSERKRGLFVPFNCSTVPHELFDSHLFGHERGAFTGAVRSSPGVIRSADGGTLFLDEIGDLPLDVQPKLLRFLQEGEIFPLGGRRPIQVNVRVLAATNHDLEKLIREGRFREDLYYRLSVIPFRIPPLRQRREDIPLLVRHFLDVLRPSGMPLPTITNRAMDILLRYEWPGNVRQLRNEIERALVFSSSEPIPAIDLKDLSPAILESAGTTIPASIGTIFHDQILSPDRDLDAILADTERALIERVLAEQQGQITASAEVLGLTRQGLYKKIKRLGIDTSRFHPGSPGPDRHSIVHLN